MCKKTWHARAGRCQKEDRVDMVKRKKGNAVGSLVPSARGFCDEDRATEMQGTQALP